MFQKLPRGWENSYVFMSNNMLMEKNDTWCQSNFSHFIKHIFISSSGNSTEHLLEKTFYKHRWEIKEDKNCIDKKMCFINKNR